MSVIALVVILLFLGALLYFVNYKLPLLHPTMKAILNFVLLAIAVVLVLYAFGLWDQIRSVKVPKI